MKDLNFPLAGKVTFSFNCKLQEVYDGNPLFWNKIGRRAPFIKSFLRYLYLRLQCAIRNHCVLCFNTLLMCDIFLKQAAFSKAKQFIMSIMRLSLACTQDHPQPYSLKDGLSFVMKGFLNRSFPQWHLR